MCDQYQGYALNPFLNSEKNGAKILHVNQALAPQKN